MIIRNEAYRDLTGVAFGHSPVQIVGKGVLAEVGECLLISLVSGEVGCKAHQYEKTHKQCQATNGTW